MRKDGTVVTPPHQTRPPLARHNHSLAGGQMRSTAMQQPKGVGPQQGVKAQQPQGVGSRSPPAVGRPIPPPAPGPQNFAQTGVHGPKSGPEFLLRGFDATERHLFLQVLYPVSFPFIPTITSMTAPA